MKSVPLSKIKEQIYSQIRDLNKQFLIQYPVERYIGYFERFPVGAGYKYLSLDFKKFYEKLAKENNHNRILELYHQLVLIELIEKSLTLLPGRNLPSQVKNLYKKNFDRILKKIQSETPWYYQIPQDKFMKDLAICSFRMIPAGVRKLEITKLPFKKFIFKNGIQQFLKTIRLIFFDLKGYKPLFMGHLDNHDPNLMAEFNRQGWIRHYQLIADLLQNKPDILGVYGESWFYDPYLKKISPELAYIREIAVNNGAQIFHIGTSQRAIKRATYLSPIRKKLYREGKYSPTNYLVVWGRKKLLDWARTI